MAKPSEYELAAKIIWQQKFGTRPIDINSDDWMDCSMDAVNMMKPQIDTDTTGQDDTTETAKGVQARMLDYMLSEFLGDDWLTFKDEYEAGSYTRMDDDVLAEVNRITGHNIQQV